MTRTTTLAALLIGLTTITPAAAEEQRWEIGSAYLIRGTGLDLGTDDGRERLLRRVERASARICRGERPKIDFDSCVEQVRARALASAPGRFKAPLHAALAARRNALLASR